MKQETETQKLQASQFTNVIGVEEPVAVKMETIHVYISAENLFGDYATAFFREANRINSALVEREELTIEEITQYVRFLFDQRIKCVHGQCTLYRQLKMLYIPAWIQHCISMIGRVVMRDIGLTLVPESDFEDIITFEEALAISNKISAFQDCMCILRDAMPRSEAGNVDVMSSALVADYVRSIKKVSHVALTYVTAFTGLKLREEAAMTPLYRMQYDDIEFIRSALLTQKGLFR